MRHPTNSRDSSDNKRKREDSDRSNEQQYEMRDRDIYFNKEGIYWFLNETLVEKYDSGDMPSMTKHPNQTRDYIFNFAKDAFESEDKAIKALQVSFYILIHDREDAIKSHIARNLLKTLFQRGVLLNDDFSINEDKLAICQDKGRNFSYILLSNGKLNAIKFLKDFMTDQLFSDSESSLEYYY